MIRQQLVETKTSVDLESILKSDNLVFSLQNLQVKYINGKRKLWMFGVDINGFSVSLGIEDFRPSFLLHWPKSDEEMNKQVVHCNQDIYLGQKLSEVKDEYDEDWDLFRRSDEYAESVGEIINNPDWDSEVPDFVSNIEWVVKTPFIGFTNKRKDRLVKITCSSIDSYAKVTKWFGENVGEAFHGDFEMSNQFLQQTGITYQSWLKVKPWRYVRGESHCNLNGRVEMKSFSERRDDQSIPALLKCFFRLKSVSRDGCLERNFMYHPNAKNEADRVVAVALTFVWTNDKESTEINTNIFTLFPGTELDSGVMVTECVQETELLSKVRDCIVAHDPDCLFYYPDYVPTMDYFGIRCTRNKNCTGLYLDRFQKFKVGMYRDIFRCDTRILVDIQAALKKKVFISVESYDLVTVSCHKDLRESPEDIKSFNNTYYDENRLITEGETGRQVIIDKCLRELCLMVVLEKDCGIFFEFANLSRVSDTDIKSTVSRGEQIRVYNKLTHFCVDDNFYVNRSKLSSKPLVFSIKQRPPTFIDPPEHTITTKLRNECYEYLQKKREYHPDTKKKQKHQTYQDEENIFGSSVEIKREEEDEVEGGNVMKPCPKFWGGSRIAVLDFASLYPSIMMAFNISYENLVYDSEYLDLPGIDYLTIPVNKSETVVLADVPGLLPKLLRLLVDNRSMIKKKMGKEPDVFKRAIYDKEQLSMKTLCNATYGFCGAEKKGSLLAIKAIMYIVTSIGRYLQKQTSDHLATHYNIPSVYGDSVVGDTALVVRINGVVKVRSIDSLIEDEQEWLPHPGDKQKVELKGVDVWQDKGFTKVVRIIRHKCEKPIVRVLTNSGVVDCTDDHSLLSSSGEKVKPTGVKKGDKLLHSSHFDVSSMCKSLPWYQTEYTAKEAFVMGLFLLHGSCDAFGHFWTITHRDANVVIAVANCVITETKISSNDDGLWTLELCDDDHLKLKCRQYHKLFYEQGEKKLPDFILSADDEFTTAFWSGYQESYNTATKVVLTALWLLAARLDKPVQLCESSDGLYLVRQQSTDPQDCVQKNIRPNIEYKSDAVVYDLETYNHHFGVGPGNLVVHNTDSVFVWVRHDDSMSLENICLDVGTRHNMDGYQGIRKFMWDQIVFYYSERNLDILTAPRQHQVNSILYLVYQKLSSEVSGIFRKEIILEFENMADNVWMSWVKKNYCYRFWDPNNPTKIKYVKITGMPVKKREYTPWTRNTLMTITNMIEYNQTEKIKQFLERQMNDLISGRIPIDQLKVSKSYKGESEYKHNRQPHLQVVLKIEKRHRRTVPPKSRVYFLVVNGSDKFYMRTETPEYVKKNNLQIDLVYYLKQQFYTPVKKLLTYHPEIVHFDTLFNLYLQRLQLKCKNILDLESSTLTSSKKMFLPDLLGSKRKKVPLVSSCVSKKRSSDPFLKFT
jgi:DNA polymerase elongation subunit (family B)